MTETRTAPYDWQRERDTIAEIREKRDVPREQFPGHKEIYLSNLEGWLGVRFSPLLASATDSTAC